MAKVTIQDCLEKIPNRFKMVEIASKRARELMEGAKSTAAEEGVNHKATVTALREIANGTLVENNVDISAEEFLNELSKLDIKESSNSDGEDKSA